MLFFFLVKKKALYHQPVFHTKWTQRDFSWNNVYPSLKHIGKSTKDKSEWKPSIQSCKPPFIEAWGWWLAVSQVEPDSLLTSLPFFFVASLEETAASHKKLFTVRRRSANSPFPTTHLALPVLSESAGAQSLPNCVRLPNLWVKCRPLRHGWAQREQSSYLQKTGKREQVLIKEERFIVSWAAQRRRHPVADTPTSSSSPYSPHPSNCRNCERKNDCN